MSHQEASKTLSTPPLTPGICCAVGNPVSCGSISLPVKENTAEGKTRSPVLKLQAGQLAVQRHFLGVRIASQCNQLPREVMRGVFR